ncbi:16S rRNA (uracil(1498)-N(3))-methyltransferase [Calderihabitans maritimus]|uniref:Ribosomal RNA small subunit methyltransferase E n=1 Tax=Calderihabitans maritimus TaxID=1246530 RepID=A0A1Z5HVL8_9FIRM|nr:16S rRNA (uracil(1498)-N(3))-methyltransferase [Calderihabitans maritimus]GAW93448.1 Ribosomal RNA small subunit methyltransferase E [Calderihabitans maritimus]
MPRFFVWPENINGERALIKGPDVRHIVKVLRMGPGDRLWLLDGSGYQYAGEIVKAELEKVVVKLLGKEPCSTEPPVRVVLVQGIGKGNKLDLVIQKGTELGVARFYPLQSERTVVKLAAEKAEDRRKRWQRIALEAAKQSRRAIVPEVEPVLPLPEILRQIPEACLKLVLWEEETSRGLKEAMRDFKVNYGRVPGEVFLFVGPEGGFSLDEVQQMKESGVIPVSLGPRILRTETAGLVAATVVLYEWGDLGGAPRG